MFAPLTNGDAESGTGRTASLKTTAKTSSMGLLDWTKAAEAAMTRSRTGAMLPLLSMTNPMVTGASSGVKNAMFCGRSSSIPSKASAVRPLTYAPLPVLDHHVKDHQFGLRLEDGRFLSGRHRADPDGEHGGGSKQRSLQHVDDERRGRSSQAAVPLSLVLPENPSPEPKPADRQARQATTRPGLFGLVWNRWQHRVHLRLTCGATKLTLSGRPMLPVRKRSTAQAVSRPSVSYRPTSPTSLANFDPAVETVLACGPDGHTDDRRKRLRTRSWHGLEGVGAVLRHGPVLLALLCRPSGPRLRSPRPS